MITKPWTWSELLAEWDYRYQERLGMLCGAATPEPWMEEMATKEAQGVIEKLARQQKDK